MLAGVAVGAVTRGIPPPVAAEPRDPRHNVPDGSGVSAGANPIQRVEERPD